MFDCVQFPRRGWVHRNRFATAGGDHDWLTLPLLKADRSVLIEDLRLADDVRGRLVTAMRRFPVLESAHSRSHPLIDRMLEFPDTDAASYLCGLVSEIASTLGIQKPMIRSSTLNIDPALRGQARVLEIVKQLGAGRYVNPPGGRELYDHGTFEREGIELRFLSPYHGSMESILTRLLAEPVNVIASEIDRETVLVA